MVCGRGRCEIDIAAVFGMLAGEDMVERRQLVEVGIACLRIAAVQLLRQLQHIIGITGLRTVNVSHEVLAGFLTGEVFTT